MTVTAEIGAFFRGSYAGVNDLGTVGFSAGALADVKTSLTPGTGAFQADRMFADTRTLAASATENLDLAGALLDPNNVAVTFVKIRSILIRARDTNINAVIIGNAASNGWLGPFGAAAHTIAIPPGGFFAMSAPQLAGWPVTAGTGDLLKVLNGGAGSAVDYDIVITGTSA